jgi:hypothetical protein
MSFLKLSDLVSGVICVSYDVVMGKKMDMSRGVEQVVYRVVGRKVNESTTLPYVSLPVVKENDVYCGVTAVIDSMVRQRQTTNVSLYDGVRAMVSSTVADYALTAVNVADRQLI